MRRTDAYHERGEDLDEIVALLRHVNDERDEIVLHGMQDVPFEFDALKVGCFAVRAVARRIGEAQVKVKCQPVLQRVRHAQFDITGAALIGLNDRVLLIDEREMVVEEERPNERQLLERLERDGRLEQLPFGFVRKEFQNEILRIRKKVMLVVLGNRRSFTRSVSWTSSTWYLIFSRVGLGGDMSACFLSLLITRCL